MVQQLRRYRASHFLFHVRTVTVFKTKQMIQIPMEFEVLEEDFINKSESV